MPIFPIYSSSWKNKIFWKVSHAAQVIHAESFELIQISSAKPSEIAFRVSLCFY